MAGKMKRVLASTVAAVALGTGTVAQAQETQTLPKEKIARSSFLMTRTIGTIRIFSSVSFPPCTGKPLSCCFVGEK